MPPVEPVSTPLAFLTPTADGRSPVAIGPPATPAQDVVQPVANTPFRPSDTTPTRTPVPSSPNCCRTASAYKIASPSVVTCPTRRRAYAGRRIASTISSWAID
ncbi:MAG: hypothetical protein DMF96_22410 [Acidobacteria bacterium]|nr:MAG: hypothetical protein DMF96_22410 [Acidobacteriota bacterium]